MNLKDFLPTKEGSRELYWAVVIESGWIQAGLWEVANQKAEVISISPPAAWETDAELVGAADTALSSAIQNLPEEGPEPSKTVFGVPPSWVAGGQIKEEYLDRIKRICGELSLEPKGFVVLPEAVAHLVKSEEGSPLNAVVVGIGKESLEIAVFRLGNLAGTTSVARSVSIVDDVSEGLSRFSAGESLPSRFIIYDGKEGELEEAKQALINVNWEEHEKIKFLHTPKVETLTPERKVLATSLAGASEIANVSFLETKPKGVPEEEGLAKAETPSPEALGFVVGKDVEEGLTPPPQTAPSKFQLPQILEKAKVFLSSLRNMIKLPQKRGTLFIGGGFALALLTAAFILWVYLPKATVTIFVSPKKLEERVEVTLSPQAQSPDFSKGILPATLLKTQVSGEKTKTTSGTKTVGDKAKGTVEIRNGTKNDINLPAGTILLSTGNLEYTLDTTASVSAQIIPGTPGTRPVNVTAGSIGAEYNLAKDETFKVGNYVKAEVAAVATSNFSGGSSRQISAVSTEDQKSLESDLTDELKDKAKNELAQSLSADKFFVDDSLTATASSRIFSNKVGDEAQNLKLSLDLKVNAFSVDKKILFDLAKEVLKGKAPAGYVLREDQIDFAFEGTQLTITANFLPEVKPDEIARKIAGKYPNQAESYLTSIPGFSRAEITIKPKLPGKLGVLPRLVSHISVEVERER